MRGSRDPNVRAPVWCDGHLDLAHLAMSGRDLTAELPTTGGPQPATVTLPALEEAGVRWAFASIFLGAGSEGVGGYAHGDRRTAHRVGTEQLAIYERLEEDGLLRIVRGADDLDDEDDGPLRVVLMMEGADAIADPSDAVWWHDRGVRIVALAWMLGSRYAGGNARPGPLTDAGRDLVDVLDELGVVHDLTHLPDESAYELLDRTDGPVIASHSNLRDLTAPDSQRHLSDDLVRVISERDGVIGLNLLFGLDAHLSRTGSLDGPFERPGIGELVDHAERMAELMDGRPGIGLGSDMDGGFGADRLPVGIETPSDLFLITGELRDRGWTESEIEGFASANWLRLLRRVLS